MSGVRDRLSDASPAYVCGAAGPRSLGAAATCPPPLAGEAWTDEDRGAPPLVWAQRTPLGGGGVQRRASHARGGTLYRGPVESTGAAASPSLCGWPREGSRSGGRPRAAGAGPVVCVLARR